jgi:preprotein translocase subunit SecY
MPIILMSALVSNVYFFSQMLHRNFRGNFITSLFGTWQEAGYQGQIVPVGGLIYYITSPKTFYEAITSPIHTIIYTLFVVGSKYSTMQVVLFSARLGSACPDRVLARSLTTSRSRECA